ncbi:hypothetical protein SAMN04488556_4084 [Halostagnicola kamekurae]|uniref:Uncharacterized protein n=1 Tax=Halostagnicola kamekurae TaxID=619731 RepID=A0A1I6UTC7_9EURY|nr:hypothetical protein SAMN04488556_4084 [Halostagnicola kamekurae]
MCQSSRNCENLIAGDDYEILMDQNEKGVAQGPIYVCLDCAQAGDSS